MTDDMRVKELLGLATQGVALPGDPGVDDIMRKADRIRRRRRVMIAVGSAAAMVAIGAGTAWLPGPGGAPPHRSTPATAPAQLPATSDPEPSPTPSGTTETPGDTNGNAPSGGANVSRGSGSPTPKATTTTATATATATTARPGTPTKPSTTPPPTNPVDVVKAMLPPGIGTIRKMTAPPSEGYDPNPLSGRYLITKDGKTGFVDIYVWDPKVPGDKRPMTIAEQRAYDHCGEIGEGPRATNCVTETLPGNGLFQSWNGPGTRDDPTVTSTHGPSYCALVYYADGRGIQMRSHSGFDNVEGYSPAMAQPPLSAEQLAQLVNDRRWFKS